jgi:hypothetical protein
MEDIAKVTAARNDEVVAFMGRSWLIEEQLTQLMHGSCQKNFFRINNALRQTAGRVCKFRRHCVDLSARSKPPPPNVEKPDR